MKQGGTSGAGKTRRVGRRGHRRGACVVAGLGGLAAAGLIFGFLVFAAMGTREPGARAVEGDAIVVLTGGAERLKVAGQLLRQGKARRLLISGVNRIVSRPALGRLVAVEPHLIECCVEIGYQAQNTRGNAVETRKWVRKHGFKRVVVVTASYHMPRSLAELGRVLPDVDLVAYPVLPERFRDRPWWFEPREARLLGEEYLKFLPAALHYGIERAIDTPGGGAGTPDQKAVAVQ